MNAPATQSPSTARLWSTIVAAFVIALVFMVACAYLWVFIYSVFIYSAGDQAYYEAYAQIASPVVAVALSFPVFFLLGRYMRRFGDKALFAAMAAVLINLTMDAAVLATLTVDLPHNLTMSFLAATAKLGGAYAGARD